MVNVNALPTPRQSSRLVARFLGDTCAHVAMIHIISDDGTVNGVAPPRTAEKPPPTFAVGAGVKERGTCRAGCGRTISARMRSSAGSAGRFDVVIDCGSIRGRAETADGTHCGREGGDGLGEDPGSFGQPRKCPMTSVVRAAWASIFRLL